MKFKYKYNFYLSILILLVVYGCHKPSGKLIGVKVYSLKGSVQVFVEQLRDLGVNTVFAGKDLSKKKDFIKTLQDSSIDVYTIWPVFFNPDTLSVDSSLFAVDKYGEIASDEWVKFVCPSREGYRKDVVKKIVRYVKKYHPSGISLDFIRHFVYWEKVYPNANPDSIEQTCYCDSCLNKFSKSNEIVFGKMLSHRDIVDEVNIKYRKQWLNWRVNLITEMVKDIVTNVHKISPDIKFNLHAVPWGALDFKGAQKRIAGQDIAELSRYVDYISPMCYSFMIKQPPEWINYIVNNMKQVSHSALIVPSIQVKQEYLESYLKPNEFSKCVKESMSDSSNGVIFWSWETLSADAVKYNIAKKLLKKYNPIR